MPAPNSVGNGHTTDNNGTAAHDVSPVATPTPNATTSRGRPSVALPGSPSKRARRERGLNWLAAEIAALIDAKRELFLEELDVVDGRDLMHPDANKWARISHHVMRASFSLCFRDGPACKSKWNQIMPDYKCLADYFSTMGVNALDYWSMSTDERRSQGLPRSFSKEVFHGIHVWFGNRPSMQPPNALDSLAEDDANNEPAHEQVVPGDETSEAETEDAMEVDAAATLHAHMNTHPTYNVLSSPAPSTESPVQATQRPHQPRMSPSRNQPRSAVPVGASVHILSSSDTVSPGHTAHGIGSSESAEFAIHRRPGNTGVRRKHLSGHTVLAEATKATGEVMANQMKEMALAGKEVENTKMELQMKIFTEQMTHQRENARIVNENARYSIEKQGEVVQCLANLCAVLSAGMHRSTAILTARQNDGNSGRPIQDTAAMDMTSPTEGAAPSDTTKN